jgi:hypothetical protein
VPFYAVISLSADAPLLLEDWFQYVRVLPMISETLMFSLATFSNAFECQTQINDEGGVE